MFHRLGLYLVRPGGLLVRLGILNCGVHRSQPLQSFQNDFPKG